jgi:hypothetical protein
LKDILIQNINHLTETRRSNQEELQRFCTEHDQYLALISKVKTQNYQLSDNEMQPYFLHPVMGSGDSSVTKFELEKPFLKLI